MRFAHPPIPSTTELVLWGVATILVVTVVVVVVAELVVVVVVAVAVCALCVVCQRDRVRLLASSVVMHVGRHGLSSNEIPAA